jgi:hypothetical protein
MIRCQNLQGLLRRLKQSELDHHRAATLTPVQDALTDKHTRLADTVARSRVLLQGGVTPALSLPDPADLTTTLEVVRTNLLSNPFSVTKGRDYKAFLKQLDALVDGLHD